MMDEEEYMEDERVMEYYNHADLWGMVCHVDLFGCNEKVNSKIELYKWVRELCDEIDMTAMGDPVIDYLDPSPELAGYSLMQLIQTSSITGHFCPNTRSAYIDIFSCKPFGPNAAAMFCARFFGSENYVMKVTFRHKEDKCKSRLILDEYAYIV